MPEPRSLSSLFGRPPPPPLPAPELGVRRWEIAALALLGLYLALTAGVRTGAAAELGRGFCAAALAQFAAAQELDSPESARVATEIWERLRTARPGDERYQVTLVTLLLEDYRNQGRSQELARLRQEIEHRQLQFSGELRLALLYGGLLLQTGEATIAISVLEPALRRGARDDPRQTTLRSMLAAAYDEAGRHTAAEQLYLGLLEAHPDEPVFQNNLAYHYARLDRQLLRAESLARTAVESQRRRLRWSLLGRTPARRDLANYLDTLGWIHYRQDRGPEAAQALREALRIAPVPQPEILTHLAQLLYDQGEEVEAAKLIEQALALQPDLNSAKRLRELLLGDSDRVDGLG